MLRIDPRARSIVPERGILERRVSFKDATYGIKSPFMILKVIIRDKHDVATSMVKGIVAVG